MSSLHGTKSTDCEEERVVDRRKGVDIKQGRGRKVEVGLYWSDSTSRWGQQCDSDGAGGVPFCPHSFLCSFTDFAQGKNTILHLCTWYHGMCTFT